MVKMGQAWSDADENQDGKLDLAEYRKFYCAIKAINEAEGVWVEQDDRAEDFYTILNTISSEEEGVSRADLRAYMGTWNAKWEELRAADGL